MSKCVQIKGELNWIFEIAELTESKMTVGLWGEDESYVFDTFDKKDIPLIITNMFSLLNKEQQTELLKHLEIKK